MQLSGELSKVSLPNLIQLARNGELTGEIAMVQGTNTATMYVENGHVVHVESNVASGRDGLLELFLWTSGTFSYVEKELGDIPRTISAGASMDRILRDGLIYQEQRRYLDQLQITAHTVLRVTPQARKAVDHRLVELLDGENTLLHALTQAGLARREYVPLLYRLLSEGQAIVVEPVGNPGQVDLPGWVVSRLKQDNPDLSRAIVDMVIWVDRVKCWMYQADADLGQVIDELADSSNSTAHGGINYQAALPGSPEQSTAAMVTGAIPEGARSVPADSTPDNETSGASVVAEEETAQGSDLTKKVSLATRWQYRPRKSPRPPFTDI